MRRLVAIALLACPLTARPAAGAGDLVVVVNPKSGVEKLSRDEVINIFLGRYRQLPGGIAAEPLDLPAGGADRALFYELLVGKDQAEINAYWARLVFSGRTPPPRQTAGSGQVIELVGRHLGAVGYVERDAVDHRVRIVFELAP